MRRLLAVALVVSCSTANEPIVEIRLPRAQPVQGEQVLAVEELTIAADFEMDGRRHEWLYQQRSEMLGKTIAVDGYAITAAEVTYKRIDESREIDDKGERLHDSRVGKTFTISRRDGELVAFPTTGSPDPREIESVLEDNEGIGVPDEIDAIIAEKTWRTGQPIAFTAEEITRVNQSRLPASKSRKLLTAMTLTLRAVRDKVAIFSIEMGLRYEGHGDQYDVHLRGQARIEMTTGHVLELGGAGGVAGTMTGVPTKGRMTWKLSSRWVGSR